MVIIYRNVYDLSSYFPTEKMIISPICENI